MEDKLCLSIPKTMGLSSTSRTLTLFDMLFLAPVVSALSP